MAESNEAWGELAAYDKELADAWDGFDTLPDPGENLVLDAFIERKNLSHQALLKLGTRIGSDGDTLVFSYGKGIKFRNMITGRMWSRIGSEWPEMKIVRAGTEPTERVIVCEGETDGARLSMLYESDVAIMPAGARYFPTSMGEQLIPYAQVLVALDKDEAGEEGADLVSETRSDAIRFPAPGDGDWSDVGHDEAIPDLPDITMDGASETHVVLPVLVPAGQLLELEVPDTYSWFEHALLPVGGQAIFHGREKSFKTYQALDMLAALSQGEPWCGFEPTEEACRVAVMQFEISWPYYHQRIQQLRNFAANKDVFDENFFTWTPLQRPRLVAGDKKAEDHVLSTLVEGNVQVILVDPIRRAAGFADLNAENEVRKILRFFERIQDEGITVVATHHDNKEGARSGGGSSLNMTGSGAFGGDADTIIGIELPRGEDENSPHRNVNFMLRNAPAIGPRSFQMTDEGQIIYDTEPYFADATAEPRGSEAIVEAPSI